MFSFAAKQIMQVVSTPGTRFQTNLAPPVELVEACMKTASLISSSTFSREAEEGEQHA